MKSARTSSGTYIMIGGTFDGARGPIIMCTAAWQVFFCSRLEGEREREIKIFCMLFVLETLIYWIVMKVA